MKEFFPSGWRQGIRMFGGNVGSEQVMGSSTQEVMMANFIANGPMGSKLGRVPLELYDRLVNLQHFLRTSFVSSLWPLIHIFHAGFPRGESSFLEFHWGQHIIVIMLLHYEMVEKEWYMIECN